MKCHLLNYMKSVMVLRIITNSQSRSYFSRDFTSEVIHLILVRVLPENTCLVDRISRQVIVQFVISPADTNIMFPHRPVFTIEIIIPIKVAVIDVCISSVTLVGHYPGTFRIFRFIIPAQSIPAISMSAPNWK